MPAEPAWALIGRDITASPVAASVPSRFDYCNAVLGGGALAHDGHVARLSAPLRL